MWVYSILIISQLLLKVREGDCLRLTNMTAPSVQDPRANMLLHCRFDMGGEELYAVKWYKDDHEFFRYTPSGEEMVEFPVPGVHVDSGKSTCTRNSCDLLLKNMKMRLSSGAYRCEVSTEAPAFRLASETRTVRVAVLPDEPPKIEGLKNSYSLGDTLVATCTSGFGDPKPILTVFLNKLPMPVKEINAYSPDKGPIDLRQAKSQLRITLEKRFVNVPITEVTCISRTNFIDATDAPSLSTTRTFSVIDPNQIVNNQKYRWADPSSSIKSRSYSQALLYLSAMLNYLRFQ